MVLEKTLESPLDSKEIKPVNPKGNLPWIFTERTDAEAEDSILWPPDEKRQLTDTRKDWRQEEKGVTENEMVGRHHWLNGHEFEQILGDSKGQESLACCSSWGRRVGQDLLTEQQQQQKKKEKYRMYQTGLNFPWKEFQLIPYFKLQLNIKIPPLLFILWCTHWLLRLHDP